MIINVRLKDGTIGVPDVYLVDSNSFATEKEAKEYILKEIVKKLRSYLNHNFCLLSNEEDKLIESIFRLDKDKIEEFCTLIEQIRDYL